MIKEYNIDIISSGTRKCISLNDYRIAGEKPWGGGNIEKSWTVKLDLIKRAIPDIIIISKIAVEELIRNGDGVWKSCSGCHEGIDGISLEPIDQVLKCQLGHGCSDCGGLGAVWDNTDYSKLGENLP